MDGIDMAVFSELFALTEDDSSFIRSLLEQYVEIGERDLVLLRTRGLNAGAKTAHGWKGRAAQLGFKRTSEIAGEMAKNERSILTMTARLEESFKNDCLFIAASVR